MVEVIITQADRDAAQELCASGWTYAGLAFANHRRAATATLTTENAALAARVEALEGALREYANLMCEGWCEGWCEGKDPKACASIGADNCAGCPAVIALAGDPS